MPTVLEVLEFVDAIGVPGLLALILIGGARGWWVFGWVYQKMEVDRNEWRTLAKTGTALADSAVVVARHR